MSVIMTGNGSCNPKVLPHHKKLLFLEMNLNVLKMRLSSSPGVLRFPGTITYPCKVHAFKRQQ